MYNCFNLDRFLDAAFNNFQKQAAKNGSPNNFMGVLCLADTPISIKFSDLLLNAEDPSKNNNFKKWQFFRTDENVSLNARSPDGRSLFIIAGQQIVSKEKLELLAIGSDRQFKDGISLQVLLKKVIESDSIPIIPWGFGKWTGSRGSILGTVLEASNGRFFIGDNSGRPNFISNPPHFSTAFKKNIKILPGSDPLPFKRENEKPGSFGFFFKGSLTKEFPFDSLRQKLYDPLLTFEKYGKNEFFHLFILNQIRMQIRKRILKI